MVISNGPGEIERSAFLKLAILFQGSLLGLALVLSWVLGRPVWEQCRFTIDAVARGAIATIPLFVFLVLVYRIRLNPLLRIRELLREILGKPLSTCRAFDLCWISLLAGISEESLFRGVLEPALSQFGSVTAIIVSNIAFGLCHAVTPTYAVLAGLMGAYLSSTLIWNGEPNLLVPICCHALYDLVALEIVRRTYREGIERPIE